MKAKECVLLNACFPQGFTSPIGAKIEANRVIKTFRLEKKEKL